MSDIHHDLTSRRRQGGIAVGLGAAVGGMLIAAMSQLATAPSAHADVVSDVVNDIQASIAIGESAFSQGASDFATGDAFDGLVFDVFGTDDILLAPSEDVTLVGFDGLSGLTEPQAVSFGLGIIPTDLSDGLQDAQNFILEGQGEFANAATEFANNQFASGLESAVDGFDTAFVYAPDDVIFGLAGSLLGM
jgi:hypothetical protein